MSGAIPSQTLQQRVTAAILDGAARAFAVHGDHASMNDVAAASGVARATVYRYFPKRQALLDELARVAVSDADALLTAARVDEVAPEEGIARAVRAFIEVGNSFVLLVRERARFEPERFERSLVVPLRRLFERGQQAGDIRADISSAQLTESLIGMVVAVITSTPALGKEDMIATITRLFLDGARARGPRPQ
jgi:TetR/AcrR family transcriptional regulator, mexCD-oprJ operon repressor